MSATKKQKSVLYLLGRSVKTCQTSQRLTGKSSVISLANSIILFPVGH